MIATANEHGVYIDGVEKIRLEGRMVVATILLAHGADEMWRWGHDNYIKGLHTGAGGASGGPHVAGDLYSRIELPGRRILQLPLNPPEFSRRLIDLVVERAMEIVGAS